MSPHSLEDIYLGRPDKVRIDKSRVSALQNRSAKYQSIVPSSVAIGLSGHRGSSNKVQRLKQPSQAAPRVLPALRLYNGNLQAAAAALKGGRSALLRKET